jgi:hypothetical protein
MIEIIKHSLGLCGENHPSLINLGILSSLLYIIFYVKDKLLIFIKILDILKKS